MLVTPPVLAAPPPEPARLPVADAPPLPVLPPVLGGSIKTDLLQPRVAPRATIRRAATSPRRGQASENDLRVAMSAGFTTNHAPWIVIIGTIHEIREIKSGRAPAVVITVTHDLVLPPDIDRGTALRYEPIQAA